MNTPSNSWLACDTDTASLQAATALLDQQRRQSGRNSALILAQANHDALSDTWEAVAITPSAKQTGYWQVSYFGPHGFTGDCQCPSKIAALQRAMREGFVVPRPGLLDEAARNPRFHEGLAEHHSHGRRHTEA